jgi:hypothetical protein
MEDLAGSFSPEELEEAGFGLYEEFRPEVARGTKGWGQAGTLSLKRVRDLARRGRGGPS